MKWDLSLVADATAGIASGSAVVTSVVTDSRLAGPTTLFVAIRGERLDGHDFLGDVLSAGAPAVVVERGRLPEGAAGVEVADTGESLIALAVRRRSELDLPVIAVTGSSGKTTTKDFLASAMGEGVHAAPMSFNNEIGVPLTVLSCPSDASGLVVEVGSRGRGHIAMLSPAIRPSVAVITNIGRAHLETFLDADAVLSAKWELIEALNGSGVAVLPADDPRLIRRRHGALLTFGERPDADMAVSDVEMDASGRTSFVMSFEGESARIGLSMAGRHQPLNAAAAAAAACATGREFQQVAAGLERAEASPWRMEIVHRSVSGGDVVVVNDAYNANPDSTAAALTTAAGMPGRKIAVLGKMLELGAIEGEAHREVGAAAAKLGFSHVLVVGEDPGISDGANGIAISIPTPAAAIEMLAEIVRPGDVVLVKASRGVGLEGIANEIGDSP